MDNFVDAKPSLFRNRNFRGGIERAFFFIDYYFQSRDNSLSKKISFLFFLNLVNGQGSIVFVTVNIIHPRPTVIAR